MPSKIKVENYFSGFLKSHSKENYYDLLKNKKFVLEKIVSKGYATPRNVWLLEDKNEFVLLLKGTAELLFENGVTTKLKEGDYFIIPSGIKHKVIKTSKKPLCYWLTLHYK